MSEERVLSPETLMSTPMDDEWVSCEDELHPWQPLHSLQPQTLTLDHLWEKDNGETVDVVLRERTVLCKAGLSKIDEVYVPSKNLAFCFMHGLTIYNCKDDSPGKSHKLPKSWIDNICKIRSVEEELKDARGRVAGNIFMELGLY
jgi:hypothetical protein